MYLTYLQENFKPVAHRSASVEVFDEEDARFARLLFKNKSFGFGLVYDVPARQGAGNVLSQIAFTLNYVGTGSRFTQLQDSAGIVKTTVKVTGNSTGISETFEVSVKYTT